MKPDNELGVASRLSQLFEDGTALGGMRQATVRKLAERVERPLLEELAQERWRRHEAEAKLAYAVLRISYLEEELSRRGMSDADLDELATAAGAAPSGEATPGQTLKELAGDLREQLDAAAARWKEAESTREGLQSARASARHEAERALDEAVDQWIPSDDLLEPVDERVDDLRGRLEGRRRWRRPPNKGEGQS